MREKIFNIIEPNAIDSKSNAIYSISMMLIIVISLLPLAFKDTNVAFRQIEIIASAIFIVDYLLRFMTADIKIGKGKLSFAIYPVTFMAIVDLLSIAPVFLPAVGGLRMLKIFRLLRTFRIFRAFKMFRYSRNIAILVGVMRKQRDALVAVATLSVGYIVIAALVIFNIEPDTFDTFFDALYWATVSLTTVGYGDIYPVSDIGRLITMISSFMGIAIVALPAGIITAGYMDEIEQ